MNTIREVQKINERELELGIAGTSASWHAQYSNSAWIYVGNIDHALSEGDLLCVLSQYGEIEDLHLARHDDEGGTGKSKGFCFCKYEDARSCILAVDNLCGIELCGRSLRIDHVENYRLPKHLAEKEEALLTNNLQPGLAYVGKELANDYTLDKGQDLFAPPPPPPKTDNTDNKIEKDSSKHDDDNDHESKEAKRRRKEERQWKRLEKEKRSRVKEQRQVEREERRRERRARKMRHESNASGGANSSSSDDDSKRKRRKDYDDSGGPERKKSKKKHHHKHHKHDHHRRHHHHNNNTTSSAASPNVSGA